MKEKVWCFDCVLRQIQKLSPYDTTDEFMKASYEKLGQYDLEDRCAHWNPKYWEKEHGFQRNWGDASVYQPEFEVLKKIEKEKKKVEFKVLCPELLRRPLTLDASYSEPWGITGHGGY